MRPEFIAELKRLVPVERRIAADGVSLRKQGRRFIAKCPFHDDSTASFTISGGLYHCFGCQASGDVVSWMREFHGLSFGQAVTELAAEAGVEVPITEGREPRPDFARRQVLHDVNTWAAGWFASQLRDGTRAYLHGRGVTDTVIRAFKLGEAPAAWQELTQAAERAGHTADALEVGLIARSPKGQQRYYDHFRDRLMCPIISLSGRVVGFSGRRLTEPAPGATPDKSAPKYVNSPESAAYNKSAELFGLHQARMAIRRARRSILVEGNVDVLAMHSVGLEHTLAPCGTALTEEQVDMLVRLAPAVTLMADGDKAGQKAMLAWVALLLPRCEELEVVVLDGADPADLVQRGGRTAVDEAMAAIRPAWDVVLDAALPRGDKASAGAKVKGFAEVAPLLLGFAPGIARDLHLKRTASWFGVGVEQLEEWLAAGAKPKPEPGVKRPMIVVRTNELERMVQEAEKALAASSQDIYVRGQMLVRLDERSASADFYELSKDVLNVRLDRAALWRIENVSGDGEEQKVRYLRSSVPRDVLGAIHTAKQYDRVPLLRGIIRVPTLRPDGTVLDRPGYDTATQTFYKPSIDVPAIPDAPTIDDAVKALELIDECYEGFEFETPADRAAAYASIISAVVRPAMQLCPMFVFDGTGIAVGKGLCADVMSVTVTGDALAPVTIYQDEDKTQRGVEAMLVSGDPFIMFDDMPEGRTIQLKFLDRMLTSGAVTTRQHYENLPTRAHTVAVFAMTGCNLRLRSDMVQRCIRVRLVSKAERPQERTFAKADLLGWVKARRAELIRACLVVVKAYLAAGGSLGEGAPPPNRRFIEWDHLVRHPLIWLGQPDPVTTQLQMRATADADAEAFGNFAECWIETFGLGYGVTTTELALRLSNATGAYEEGKVKSDYELKVLLQSWTKGKLTDDVARLGATLSRFVGRRRGAARFAKGEAKGRTTYRFEAAE